MKYDGSLEIDVDLKVSKAEKSFDRLKKKIIEGERELEKTARLGDRLAASVRSAAAELEQARRVLYEMSNAPVGTWGKGAVLEQWEQVRLLQTDYERLAAAWKRVHAQLERAAEELKKQKEAAGAMTQEAAKAEAPAAELQAGFAAAGDYVKKLGERIQKMVSQSVAFAIMVQALKALKAWLGKAVQANTEARGAIARLKGALLTLAQPIVNLVVPAFTLLVNVLTRIVTAVSSFVSRLFGTTIEASSQAAESLYNEVEALEGTGAAAKKAEKSLAAFDEINQLSGQGAGSGGAGAGTGSIAPDFTPDLGSCEAGLNRMTNLVLGIGGMLAGWKIASGFTQELSMLAGIALAVGGGLMFAFNILDAWNNGIDWENLTGMMGGFALAVAGLGLAFGNVGAGIALVVGGILLLVTGFKDVMENGVTLENTLAAIAGIIATGLGIALLTGSLIPALIAGILAIIYALVVWQGNGVELAENLKLIFGGLIEFITGIFSGDWESALNGLKNIAIGTVNSVIIVFESMVNAIIGGINWLIGKINSVLGTVDFPDGRGGIISMELATIPKVSLPRIPALAKGAVIPPNREFMAVLGDQRSGTNIEAPLATMVQAFRQAMSEGGYGGTGEAVLEVDGQQFGKLVYRYGKKENRRIGVSLIGG